MSPFAIALLALSMSVDAFAAALGRGAAREHTTLGNALLTGAVFGSVEAITPVLGWLFGVAAGTLIQSVDHWIAFGLLVAVGLHMLNAAWHPGPRSNGREISFGLLAATAIGTSIDAMTVGVSLGFLDVDIVPVALAVGVTTFTLAATGMLIGRIAGQRLGQAAEAVAGVLLCTLGTLILVDHLYLGGGGL